MSIDRRAVEVLLAVLQIEQRELAQRMGYDAAYTANVLNGFTQLSRPFRRAFGEAVGDLILGDELAADVYPAGPLLDLIERRAAEASNRNDFFADLGLNKQGFRNRRRFSVQRSTASAASSACIHPRCTRISTRSGRPVRCRPRSVL